MFRTLSAMAGSSALAAALFIAIPVIVNASAPAPVEKSDQAEVYDCITQGWPYYARSCLRDETRNAGRASSVRLVTPDRIDNATAEAAAGPPGAVFAEVEPEHPPSQLRKTSQIEAPSNWAMSNREVRLYLSAGDFVRHTVH
jgi:hypothetical protein